jgi:TPR repeat protein
MKTALTTLLSICLCLPLMADDELKDTAFFETTKALAEKGNIQAQYTLGVMYSYGVGIKRRDLKEGLRWDRKSADQGGAYAPYRLGLMYANGVRVSKSHKEAVKWYRKSAEQGL